MKVAHLAISVVSATLATTAIILFLTQRTARLSAEGQLVQARAEISALEANAKTLRENVGTLENRLGDERRALGALRNSLDASEARSADARQKLSLAQNLLNLRDENERTLNREIASLNRELAGANTRLAEMETLRAHIAQLEQAVALARNPSAPDGRPSPASTQTPRSILALGPSDSFLVVNHGLRDGAVTGQRLIIRRGTELIGTALISATFEDVSIAQVDPHSLREALRTGDAIVLTP